MAQLNLVSAELGAAGPCVFHFEIDQGDGRYASLDLQVARHEIEGGVVDVGRCFAEARGRLVSVLLRALVEANHLDEGLVPDAPQEAPNASTELDLRPGSRGDGRGVVANDDHRPIAGVSRRGR